MVNTQATVEAPRIAFLLDNLAGGGAERVVLQIAAGFAARGYTVDLLVCEMRGELCDAIPKDVPVRELSAGGKLAGLWNAFRFSHGGAAALAAFLSSARKIPRSFSYIAPVRDYLREHRPQVMFSALAKANVCAVLAANAAGVGTRVYIGLQNAVSMRTARGVRDRKGQMRHMSPLMSHCYGQAAGIVAASRGVADDAVAFLELDAERIDVVYNPVELPPVQDLPPASLHPWLGRDEQPVVLGIGRLVKQKNFPLLLDAFALVRDKVDARLIILGGDAASEDQQATADALRAHAAQLGITDWVDLPGYRPNPQDYLAHAQVFVLSSRFEGFGNVVVEALLSGCPVVSTDCPSGPSEILDGGRYGTLVPTDDEAAMAEAILATLAKPPPAQTLRERGQAFSRERAVAGYVRVFFGEESGR